ncbi:MAG: type II secretion system protein [bacterium]
MKKNKGFTIIETLIVVVMMTTSLLMISSSYSASINNEKKRIYYDDVVDIYKVDSIKNFLLENSNIEGFIESYLEGNDNLYANLLDDFSFSSMTTVSLFNDDDSKDKYEKIQEFYEVERLIVFKTDFASMSICTNNEIYSGSSRYNYCRNFQSLGADYITYLRSLGSNINFDKDDYLVVAEFSTGTSKSTYAYSFLGGAND